MSFSPIRIYVSKIRIPSSAVPEPSRCQQRTRTASRSRHEVETTNMHYERRTAVRTDTIVRRERRVESTISEQVFNQKPTTTPSPQLIMLWWRDVSIPRGAKVVRTLTSLDPFCGSSSGLANWQRTGTTSAALQWQNPDTLLQYLNTKIQPDSLSHKRNRQRTQVFNN